MANTGAQRRVSRMIEAGDHAVASRNCVTLRVPGKTDHKGKPVLDALLRAERRAGELLREMAKRKERHGDGRPTKTVACRYRFSEAF